MRARAAAASSAPSPSPSASAARSIGPPLSGRRRLALAGAGASSVHRQVEAGGPVRLAVAGGGGGSGWRNAGRPGSVPLEGAPLAPLLPHRAQALTCRLGQVHHVPLWQHTECTPWKTVVEGGHEGGLGRCGCWSADRCASLVALEAPIAMCLPKPTPACVHVARCPHLRCLGRPLGVCPPYSRPPTLHAPLAPGGPMRAASWH